MKKRILKIGLTALLLLTALATAATASAEENGYWTAKTDESGNTVMIYTYTGPVEWTIDDQSGYGRCGDANPGVVPGNAPNNGALAASTAAAAQTAAVPADAAVKPVRSSLYMLWSFLLPLLAAIAGAAVTVFAVKRHLRRRAPATVRLT